MPTGPDPIDTAPPAAPSRPPIAPRLLLGAGTAVLAAVPTAVALHGEGIVRTIAAAALMALLIVVSGAYVRRYEPPVWADIRRLSVAALLLLGMMYLTVAISMTFPDLPAYVMPVPLAAMLATQLTGARVGLLVTVVTSVAGQLLGFADGFQAVAVFAASVAAIIVFSNVTQRRQLVGAGLHVMATLGASSALAAAADGALMREALLAGVEGVAGGALSAVLAYGSLPFLEQAFGLTTSVRLLELSSPSSPLMRELMQRAPGTYAHSLLAGNLAETAAEAIGADPLLARVGAYYHDVGKLRRPSFFVENLAGGDNPHDETSPSLSALIITAHVREGLELASEHGLPPELVSIIREHHGDSLVSYFYDKAASGTDPVFEADFRYSGDRPTSREAALVMLADCVEATVRSMERPSGPRIEAAVRRVVDEKVSDGQLRDSSMTLSDIERVVGVYSNIMSRMHHARVDYPDESRRRRMTHAGKRDEQP